MERMEAEMEILRTQNRMVIQRTNLGFLNEFYAKAGLSLLFPRQRTFDFRVESGVGAWAGLGHYLGRHNVVDLAVEWDVYPALALRYRYEFHGTSPQITWGPVLGFRTKAAPIAPFDNFLDKPDEVRTSFFFAGGILGFPVGRWMIVIEAVYLINRQALLVMNGGFHIFL